MPALGDRHERGALPLGVCQPGWCRSKSSNRSGREPPRWPVVGRQRPSGTGAPQPLEVVQREVGVGELGRESRLSRSIALDPVVDAAARTELVLGARITLTGVVERVERHGVPGRTDPLAKLGTRNPRWCRWPGCRLRLRLRAPTSGSQGVGIDRGDERGVVEVAPSPLDVVAEADLRLVGERERVDRWAQQNVGIGRTVEDPPVPLAHRSMVPTLPSYTRSNNGRWTTRLVGAERAPGRRFGHQPRRAPRSRAKSSAACRSTRDHPLNRFSTRVFESRRRPIRWTTSETRFRHVEVGTVLDQRTPWRRGPKAELLLMPSDVVVAEQLGGKLVRAGGSA